MNWIPKIGMKVVCIKRGVWRSTYDGTSVVGEWTPEYGGVYTISDVLPVWDAIRLKEDTGFFSHWHIIQFRPLLKRKTDISEFKKLLKPVTAPEPA